MKAFIQAYKNSRSWLDSLMRRSSWHLTVKRETALIGALVRVCRLLARRLSRSWILAIVSFSRNAV